MTNQKFALEIKKLQANIDDDWQTVSNIKRLIGRYLSMRRMRV